LATTWKVSRRASNVQRLDAVASLKRAAGRVSGRQVICQESRVQKDRGGARNALAKDGFPDADGINAGWEIVDIGEQTE